jgi:U3 small nucleolar RNA-associated protein 21
MELFSPFRVLGLLTTDTPFAVQRRGRATFLTVSAGSSWQCFNCARLTLLFVGQAVRELHRRREPL